MSDFAYNARAPHQQARTAASVAWTAITAVTSGVDTVQVGWNGKRPKALKRLLKIGGLRYQRPYGRTVVRVHNLTQAQLAEIERLAITEELNIQRVDHRFDFSFDTFMGMWTWLRFERLWIPFSRNATRLEFADYIYNGEPVPNGNYALHDYRKTSARKGSKPSRTLQCYRNPRMLTGLPYPKPTCRAELRILGTQAVQRFVPSLSTIMRGDPEDILRKHVCLRIDGVNCEIPPLPVPIEWEVDT